MAHMRQFDTGATRDTAAGKPEYAGFLSAPVSQRLDAWLDAHRQFAWAGGLFEGEGYIGARLGKLELQVKMCDEDTVRRFCAIVRHGKVYGPYQVKPTKTHQPIRPWRPYYTWQVRGEQAESVALLLLPYLGSRRSAKLSACLDTLRPLQVSLPPRWFPDAMQRFGEYMHRHRWLPDGTMRDSRNWQLGIPLEAYMQSMWRHLIDMWLHHEGMGHLAKESLEDALCGILFNCQGFMHESLKSKP